MRQHELVERVANYTADLDPALLDKAYVYAMNAHKGQTRKSGDPYFSHPLEVAAIVTDMHLDQAAVVAALLHDTVEDTHATHSDIEEKFGQEIARLVDGLTKLKNIELVSKKMRQGENLRRLLIAVSEDVRVLLVKLADRLHNMRTLGATSEEQRRRIAQETMDIYAPLAGRMGMQDMRDELEELSFRFLFPDEHEMVTERLERLFRENEGLIESISKDLTETFSRFGISARINGRRKRPYSVFRKMERNRVSFEQLSDIFGFRVIVEELPACYAALGVAHTRYNYVPGRFKDYISNPKQNDYQSIHTTIYGPSRQRVELQIRSQRMHEVAEYGIAAHAVYKDGQYGAMGIEHPGAKVVDERLVGEITEVSRSYAWLRRTVEALAEGGHPDELLEQTRLEMFHDQVFCFTPKGRLIAMPQGATAIDFAYAIHTDVGNTCVGARINGRTMPVVTQLANGDEVEIVTDPSHEPPAVWEKIVVTGKARAGIRRAAREAAIAQFAELGQAILERAFERAGKPFTRKAVQKVLSKLARHSVEEVLASVGRGEIPSSDVVKAVHPDHRHERAASPKPEEAQGWFNMHGVENIAFRVPGLARMLKEGRAPNLPVRGADTALPVRIDPGAGAVPGDRIVGIVETDGDERSISIYPIQSPALGRYMDKNESWLDLRWDLDDDAPNRFPARVRVSLINQPGTLRDVCEVFGEVDANISGLHLDSPESEVATIDFKTEVYDLKHLARLLTQLRSLPVVTRAERLYE